MEIIAEKKEDESTTEKKEDENITEEQVFEFCSKRGWEICDGLPFSCSCKVSSIGTASGYQGKDELICTNCCEEYCPQCHWFCTSLYYGDVEQCYECEGPCYEDPEDCKYREKYNVVISSEKHNFRHKFEAELHKPGVDFPLETFEKEITTEWRRQKGVELPNNLDDDEFECTTSELSLSE